MMQGAPRKTGTTPIRCQRETRIHPLFPCCGPNAASPASEVQGQPGLLGVEKRGQRGGAGESSSFGLVYSSAARDSPSPASTQAPASGVFLTSQVMRPCAADARGLLESWARPRSPLPFESVRRQSVTRVMCATMVTMAGA